MKKQPYCTTTCLEVKLNVGWLKMYVFVHSVSTKSTSSSQPGVVLLFATFAHVIFALIGKHIGSRTRAIEKTSSPIHKLLRTAGTDPVGCRISGILILSIVFCHHCSVVPETWTRIGAHHECRFPTLSTWKPIRKANKITSTNDNSKQAFLTKFQKSFTDIARKLVVYEVIYACRIQCYLESMRNGENLWVYVRWSANQRRDYHGDHTQIWKDDSWHARASRLEVCLFSSWQQKQDGVDDRTDVRRKMWPARAHFEMWSVM